MSSESTNSLPEKSFSEKLDALRRGIPGAHEAFLEEYGPYVRRALRIRLRRTLLQAAADSADLCQSVMASFLLRLAAGQFELANELDMRHLLAAMAHKKFLMFRRYELASKRDRRLTQSLTQEPTSKAEWAPGESLNVLQNVEQKLRQLLTAEEYQLFELRQQGIAWNSIAENKAIDATTLRKRYSRALSRVAIQLGIDWDNENR
jgi:hypothetical protein